MTNTTPASTGADALRKELIADLREVFYAGWQETPQIVRDVIEYADSWLRVYIQKGAESAALAGAAQPAAISGDPAEPRDDSDRTYDRPIGYLPASELGRLHAGHGANLRSAKFGPSALDGDVPVYLDAALAAAPKAAPARWIGERIEQVQGIPA